MRSKLSIALTVLSLFLASTQTTQAWWFMPASKEATVQPQTATGPVISPLIDSLIPRFILEPLQAKEPEQPPTATNPALQPALRLSPLVTTTPKSATYTSVAQRMLNQINDIRNQHGLDPLHLNAQLSQSAQAYAELMQQQDHFSHTSPDGQSFRQRNEAAGYTNWQRMGENLGRGHQTVAEVIQGWMDSPSHRDNILNPNFAELGVGFAPGSTNYWVQEFGLQFP